MARWYRTQSETGPVDQEVVAELTRSKQTRRARHAAWVVLGLFLGSLLVNVIEDRYVAAPGLGLEYSLLRTLPLRTYTKLVKFMAHTKFFWPLNVVLLKAMQTSLGISLEEAERTALSEYSTLNDLFARKIDLRHRPLGQGVTSAADGVVVYAGLLGDETCPIKGATYTVEELLGTELALAPTLIDPARPFYQVVVYLAPSNYHRFHVFKDFHLREIRHIPSQLFSVGRAPMRYLRGLLAKNERVVFSGETEWGYAALVAVGSTGVGSIVSDHAPELSTGQYFHATKHWVLETDQLLAQGDELGTFNLGSTVVMIFQAPPEFKLTCQAEMPIRVRESIGEVSESSGGGAREQGG